jgi:hypothetical protein
LRFHLAVHLGNTEPGRDRPGGRLAVAGGHDHYEAGIFECRQRFWRGGLDRIGDGDQSGQNAALRQVHDACPFPAQCLGIGLQDAPVDVF